jgi:hypothetical protein
VARGPITAALAAAQLSRNENQHVIVIMNGRPAAPPAPAGSDAATVRVGKIASARKPLMSELSEAHAIHVKAYRLVNWLAAMVSAGEKAQLKATASVA